MTARILGLEVGFARVVVTPEKPVFLAGLSRNRVSRGVHDDLYVRAVVLCDNSRTVALVGVDSIGLMYDYLKRVEGKLLKRGVALLVGSSHDHSSPDVIGLWGPSSEETGVDDEYLDYLLESMLEAVEEALSEVSRVTLEVGYSRLPPGVAKNTRDPGFIDFDAPYMVFRRGSEVLGLLVNFGLHPEVLWSDNRLVTADFVHYMLGSIEAELGGVAIFLNGALGGMVTPNVKSHTYEEAERIGTTIASSIIGAVRNARVKYEALGQLKLARKRLVLPVANEELIQAVERGVVRRRIVEPSSVETEVNFLEIEPFVQLVTLPGEPLPKVGFKAKSLMTKRYRFLVGLGNDEVGYIIDLEDWSPRKYEESMSLGPLTAEILLSTIAELANAYH